MTVFIDASLVCPPCALATEVAQELFHRRGVRGPLPFNDLRCFGSLCRSVLVLGHGLPLLTASTDRAYAYTGGVTEQQAGLIVADSEVVGGQARVRGTRIPVSVVLDCLAAGMTEDEILQQYPSLTVEGVRAGAAYGASLAREEIIQLPV